MGRLRSYSAAPIVVAALMLVLAGDTGSQNLEGRNPIPEQALSETTWIEQVDVSPDGRRIVFKSARGENYNLWTVLIEGGEPERLTGFRPPMRAKNPRWSPDGNWIAFQVDQHTKYSSERDDVYVIAASGGEPRNLTDTDWVE